MATASNVYPLLREQVRPEAEEPQGATLLGKLCRDDFELWISRSAGGTLSLKWWRWRDDAEFFDPMEDGGLTLDPDELRPLADLLTSVAGFMEKKQI